MFLTAFWVYATISEYQDQDGDPGLYFVLSVYFAVVTVAGWFWPPVAGWLLLPPTLLWALFFFCSIFVGFYGPALRLVAIGPLVGIAPVVGIALFLIKVGWWS